MSDCTLLDWALHYRSLGLSVFPVREKVPLVPWKEFQTRIANENEIKAWWEKWPDASIGMATGAITGRFILDIDGEAGRRSIEGREIPPTAQVRTQRGVHHHFRMPQGLDKSTLAGVIAGVDVRGEGGYVKLPPSRCTDGTRYEWASDMNRPLAEAPQWLLALLAKPQVNNVIPDQSYNKEHWVEEIIEGVGDGERHAALVRLAGYYFNIMPPAVAKKHLIDWNEKNTPPMEEPEFGEQLEDLYKRFKNGEYTTKYKEPRKLYQLQTATELLTQYKNKIDWLVSGLIPVGSTCILSGYQGLGKTFCATDLIVELSKKKGIGKWLGAFSTKSGPVLYLDNEMSPYLTSYRLQQILRAKGLTTDDLQLFYSARNRIKLTDPVTYKKLQEDMTKLHPVLVVMDSFASCFTLDENSSRDIRHFFDDLIAPLADEHQCAFLFLDHERKGQPGESVMGNKRLRGSGAKGDSVDTILSLDYRNGALVMEQSKARYSKRHEPFVVKIEDTGLGIKIVNGGSYVG